MYNGNSTAIAACYPFYTSQSDFNAMTSISSSGLGTISIGDFDNYWTVMPGYKLEVYSNNNYGGTLLLNGDNTSGTVPVNYMTSPADQASSIKLFFKGTLIEQPDKATTISVPLFNGSTVTVSNYATTYDIAFGSTYYHVYEFYAGSNRTLSFTGSSTVSNIQALLIGGGGGGGCFAEGGGGTAAGGGGAGAFLTTTFSAIPGSTFNVNVGAGGAGGAASTNAQGTAGSSTSISRTYNSVVDNTLTAGGGGSGGAPIAGQVTGSIGNPWGSTGGASGYLVDTQARAVGAGYTVTGSVFTSITASAFIGGNSSDTAGGGGGGGAGGAGVGARGSYNGGAGGSGKAWTVTGGRLFAGGGGGVRSMNVNSGNATNGAAGSGGGGAYPPATNPVTQHTGSGGGGGYSTNTGGNGANGICIIAIPV